MVSPDDPRIARCGFCRLEGDGGLDFFAQRYEIALGRKSKSTHLDVVLGDNMNISRNHAKIVFREGVGGLPGHWELEVLGKNGVTVNGTLHTPSETGGCVKLRSGDHLSMGDNSFHFLLPARTIRHMENGQPVVKRLKLSHRPSPQARSNPPAKRPSVPKPRATTPPPKPKEASQEPAAISETKKLEQTLKSLMQDDKQLQDKLHEQELQEAKLRAKLQQQQQQSSQQWSNPMRMSEQRDTPPTPFQISQQSPASQQAGSSGMTFRSGGFRSHVSMPAESSTFTAAGYHPQQVQQLLRQLPPAIQQQVTASQQLSGYQALPQQRSAIVSGGGLSGHASMPVYESSFQGQGSSSQATPLNRRA
ncbi:hypothetical protein WJX73_008037 [Symbiochloris irregularis]|uniref:FHA domain-containing protein n=1 Tax=Symbiochloris irregularis TaxID=706552 RepID=A0AAW1NQU1_9CHLO